MSVNASDYRRKPKPGRDFTDLAQSTKTSARTPLVPEKVIPGIVESLLPDPIEGYSARMVEEIPDQYYFMRCQVGRVVTKKVAVRDSVTREVIRTAEVPVFFLKGVGPTFGAALEMAKHGRNGRLP